MKRYKLSYGLSGGFGGARESEDIYQFKNEDEAYDFAYHLACEVYDSYAGLHSLRSLNEIMELVEDEDEAWEIYREERESWLHCSVREVE